MCPALPDSRLPTDQSAVGRPEKGRCSRLQKADCQSAVGRSAIISRLRIADWGGHLLSRRVGGERSPRAARSCRLKEVGATLSGPMAGQALSSALDGSGRSRPPSLRVLAAASRTVSGPHLLRSVKQPKSGDSSRSSPLLFRRPTACQEAAAARPTDFDVSSAAGPVGLSDQRYHQYASIEPSSGPDQRSRASEQLRSVRTWQRLIRRLPGWIRRGLP